MLQHSMTSGRVQQSLPWLLAGMAAAGALAWSNPGPAEFEAFAGERLVELIAGELCRSTGLPLAVTLLVRDCPQLIHSQRGVLGALAAQQTRRLNAGLFSLYLTDLGGQTVLPGLTIPRYRALTLACAGQLTVLQAGGETGRPNQR
jgi:hypothetical protein